MTVAIINNALMNEKYTQISWNTFLLFRYDTNVCLYMHACVDIRAYVHVRIYVC